MTTKITCLFCKGTGSTNNPPTFHDEGKADEPSIDCEVCNGLGSIEVSNPAGIRGTVLVARKIKNAYPQFNTWEEIYCFIVANISNAINASVTSSLWHNQSIPDLSFDDDTVFSEYPLPIDTYLEKWIEKGNFLEEAKTILNIND